MARKKNSQRLGAPTPEHADTPIAATSPRGDILSFVTPTEVVDLPSDGRYYPDGHSLHNTDSIEIRHMTAKEEDILTSEALLRKGLALDRMLQALLVDQTINLDDLLVGDKNALIVAARITGFGSEYITNLTCPSCNEANEAEFDLEDIEHSTGTADVEGVTFTSSGTFTFTLPTTGVEAEVRLLTTATEKMLTASALRKKKMNLPNTNSTDLLKSVVVSINGVTDTEMINKFVDLMPSLDSRHIRKVYDQVKPDVDLRQEFVCDHCSYTGKVVMPLTAEFFWPNS